MQIGSAEFSSRDFRLCALLQMDRRCIALYCGWRGILELSLACKEASLMTLYAGVRPDNSLFLTRFAGRPNAGVSGIWVCWGGDGANSGCCKPRMDTA